MSGDEGSPPGLVNQTSDEDKLDEWRKAFSKNEGSLFKKKEKKHVPEEFRRPKGKKGQMDALGADSAIKMAEAGGRAARVKTCLDDEAGLERLYELIAALSDDTDGVLYKEDVLSAHGGDPESLFDSLESDVSGAVSKQEWLEFVTRRALPPSLNPFPGTRPHVRVGWISCSITLRDGAFEPTAGSTSL